MARSRHHRKPYHNTQRDFSDDFNRDDGAVGSGWQGTNIAIASNRLIITPTLETEKLTDGGLEAAYTAGKCNTLTSAGSMTLAEETSDVHGGSKAQSFVAGAFNDRVNFPTTFSGTLGSWFEFSAWSKRTAGTGGSPRIYAFQTGGLDRSALLQQGATYAQSFVTDRIVHGSNAIFAYPVREQGASAFSTVLVDDASFKQITLSSMFALRSYSVADCVLKAQVYWHPGTVSGIAARIDSTSNPQNGIVAYIREQTSSQTRFINVVVDKVVAGVWSNVYASSALTYVDGAQLELHLSGSTVQVWWNNVQRGGDLTIADAGILNSKLHGLFASNPANEFDAFFLSIQ